MLGSSISTIVIFIPFVLMSGVAGAYFKVLTNTMIITLVCSFFVTWIGLPVIYLLLSQSSRQKSSPGEASQREKSAMGSIFYPPALVEPDHYGGPGLDRSG